MQNTYKKLKNATINSLKLLDKYKLKTIAFPAISTCILGYPIDRWAKIMISTAKNYLKGNARIQEAIFYLFSLRDFEVFKQN